jgi:hypothetical protein
MNFADNEIWKPVGRNSAAYCAALLNGAGREFSPWLNECNGGLRCANPPYGFVSPLANASPTADQMAARTTGGRSLRSDQDKRAQHLDTERLSWRIMAGIAGRYFEDRFPVGNIPQCE